LKTDELFVSEHQMLLDQCPFDPNSSSDFDTVGEDLFRLVRLNITGKKVRITKDDRQDAVFIDKLLIRGFIVDGTTESFDKIPTFSIIELFQFLRLKAKLLKEHIATNWNVFQSDAKSDSSSSSSSLLSDHKEEEEEAGSDFVPDSFLFKAVFKNRDPFSIDLESLLQHACLMENAGISTCFERFSALFFFMRLLLIASPTLDDYRAHKRQGISSNRSIHHHPIAPFAPLPGFQIKLQQLFQHFSTSYGRDFNPDVLWSPGSYILSKKDFFNDNVLLPGDVFVPLEEKNPGFDFMVKVMLRNSAGEIKPALFLFECKYALHSTLNSSLPKDGVVHKTKVIQSQYKKGPRFSINHQESDIQMDDVFLIVLSAHDKPPPVPPKDERCGFSGHILISSKKILMDWIGKPLNNCGILLKCLSNLSEQKSFPPPPSPLPLPLPLSPSSSSSSSSSSCHHVIVPPSPLSLVSPSKYVALHRFNGFPGELSFEPSQIIENVVRHDGIWLEGKVDDRIGRFPDSFATLLVEKEEDNSSEASAPA